MYLANNFKLKPIIISIVFAAVMALLLITCGKNTTQPPPAGADTTSHNFTWTIDTLGTRSSYLNDVAIINENDIWAVGEIHTNETDQFDSLGNWIQPYNAVHWNGSEWELKRIRFKIFCNQSATQISPAKSVLSFASDDVWITAGSQITHWNGNQFDILECIPVSVNKMWGTSGNDIYVVGALGGIAHYDGSSWQKLDSGIDIEIQDIWGTTNPQNKNLEVLCIAANKFRNEGKRLLRIKEDGTIETLPDSGLSWSLSSVWFVPGEKYYIVGAGIYQKADLNSTNLWKRYPPGEVTNFFTNSIRGVAMNDIVAVGAFGEIVHFNGHTWRNYSSETQLTSGGYFSIAMKDNLIIGVGQLFNLGVIVTGKR